MEDDAFEHVKLVDAVQEEIGHAQDVREVLFLDAGEAVLDGALVGGGLGLLAEVLDGADEEAAGAAGRVEDGLAEAGIDLLDDELGDGARGVELAGVARGLEISRDSTLLSPLSAYFWSRASSTARDLAPYLAKTFRFFTFSARSLRVSGGASNARPSGCHTWYAHAPSDRCAQVSMTSIRTG